MAQTSGSRKVAKQGSGVGGRESEQWGKACDFLEPESQHPFSNGNRCDVILSWAWSEVSLLGFFPGKISEILSPELAYL